MATPTRRLTEEDVWSECASRGHLVLDGGLATQLETRGNDLSDPLWSAEILRTRPEEIRKVHDEYAAAGAQILTTATYQATPQGLSEKGLNQQAALDLIADSVALAQGATESGEAWVAASIGPYGAFLHDGSEYRGDYQLDVDALVEFHRPRFDRLAATNAAILACETIPCLAEARALLRLLESHPGSTAWFSFTLRDSQHLPNGDALAACAELLSGSTQVAAIGVNCVPPNLTPDAVQLLRQHTDKPIIVYPNSGERWDAKLRSWGGLSQLDDFLDAVNSSGAEIRGGCCRTGPAHVRGLRQAID